LRRVHLHLTGLLPSPEEQEAFLNDQSPDAYAKVVEDLLSRPQYSEPWARHWLDVVHDLHATALYLMGLDHTFLTYFHAGRNMRLTDVHGEVVKQLIA
jgi:hypothetical protein